jgi:hypothetical protein
MIKIRDIFHFTFHHNERMYVRTIYIISKSEFG